MDGRKLFKVSNPSIFFFAAFTIFTSTFIQTAFAHTVMVSSTPAINAKVKELPTKVKLTFADALLQIKGQSLNSLSVIDPMNQDIAKGSYQVHGAVLSATLHPTMRMDGTYTVNFRVVAQDGHIVQGHYDFYVNTITQSSTTSNSMKDMKSGIFNFSVISSANLAPNGNPKSSFTANIRIDLAKNQFCYKIKTQSITNITAIHLHPLAESSSKALTVLDEVFILLSKSGVNRNSYLCAQESNSTLNLVVSNPTHYAIMIHTKNYPDGVSAGRL